MRKSRLIIVGVVAATIGAALPIALAIGAAQSTISRSDLGLLAGVIELVQRDYVHPVGSSELTKDALKGMLNKLDPHSDYMDEQEFKETSADMSGQFGGLGIQISERNGVPKVISPIDGTPAAEAGIQPGDLIAAVDGQSTQGVSLSKIVRVLRGTPGSTVTLSLVRGTQEPLEVTITRRIITVATVKSKLQPNSIGYARITEFGENTPADFNKALADLKQQAGGNLKGLVLDVRNDAGGLLSSAVAVAGDFLDGGKVVTIRGRNNEDDHAYNAPPNGDRLAKTPIVVLINGASASASEIVAGALQDRKRATVMGTQSFGKGSVQTVIPLNGHGALRLTTALYYTPNGRSIQGQGIAPNEVVEVPKEQQVSGGLMLREDQLQGAFRNPGALGKKPAPGDGTAQTMQSKPAAAVPIKIDLIGTDEDGQLKAALAYLARANSGTTGEAAKP